MQRELDDDKRFTDRYDTEAECDAILDDLIEEAMGEGPPEGVASWLAEYLTSSTMSKGSLVSLLDTLIDTDAAGNPQEAHTIRAIEDAHDALIGSILENDLGPDAVGLSSAWNAAAEAGDWPLDGDPPEEFAEAVTDAADAKLVLEASEREAAAGDKAKAVHQLVTDWRGDGRLLAGTLNAIRQKVDPSVSAPGLLVSFQKVYDAQRDVTRANWLAHLQCTKTNRIDGDSKCHFTTFANGVMPGEETLGVSAGVPTLLTSLFSGATWDKQVHATVVVGSTRYHRYWNGKYTSQTGTKKAVNGAPVGATKVQLDVEWTRMQVVMTGLVTKAKDQHGRIGANQHGGQIKVDKIL